MLRIKGVTKNVALTNRGLLSFISSIYDPVGLIAPVTLEPKLIIQDLWRRQIDWDVQLPDDLKLRWTKWKQTLQFLEDVEIPRWYGFTNTEFGQVQLHIFADASQYAYGAVVYIRYLHEDFIHCSFVTGKSRLAPIQKKSTSIPRLELQAAVTAVRLKDTCIEELKMKVDNVYFYSDSKTVINYIHNDYSNFGVFVAHRIPEIRNHSEPKQCYYVPSKLNVADHATRCVNVQNLQNNCRWFNGPKFLCKVNTEEYLTRNNINLDPKVDNADINIVKIQATDLKQNKLSINWHYFSNIDKIVRLLAWFLKLKHNWISWKRNKPERENFNLLTFQELKNARVILLRISQSESYPNDYNLLTTDRSLPQTSSLLTLTPIVKKDLICVGGRINYPH